MRLLLLTPPMTQLNTPYPATAYLTGFLRQHSNRLDLEVEQADPALELFLRLYCGDGLRLVAQELRARADEHGRAEMPAAVEHFLANAAHIIGTVDSVIRFLQGSDPSLAARIARRDFLPEGPRFAAIGDDEEDTLAWAFGELGTSDRAKYIASLYIDDIGDAVRTGIDERFELSRYAERLAASAASFEPMLEALEGPTTLIDELIDEISADLLEQFEPDIVGLTAPFPGNVYGALRIARAIKSALPTAEILFGGGYVNTELRELSEPRVFDYVDYVILDDGERPLLRLLEMLRGGGVDDERLVRTFVRRAGVVVYRNDTTSVEVEMSATGVPTYDGLPLDSYVSMFEMLNPMHRLWSGERWNKLTVAHGCYWKKCAFCDISLDYIRRYDPLSAEGLVDRIEALVDETGESGFHFVDEAAPPARLRALAERLLARNITVSWWGNIRFEKTFTAELAELLAASGCIAISGGLEVASDRLLALMNKGVTVEQVARVTRGFSRAGVLVHAYLMYGFPSQTMSETLDSLERVRQLFVADCIHSGFWHRFAATAHSPIGQEPARFGIQIRRPSVGQFANNDLAFSDPSGVDHDRLGGGLRKALYNYMHGLGLEDDVRIWFDELELSQTSVSPSLVATALASDRLRDSGDRLP